MTRVTGILDIQPLYELVSMANCYVWILRDLVLCWRYSHLARDDGGLCFISRAIQQRVRTFWAVGLLNETNDTAIYPDRWSVLLIGDVLWQWYWCGRGFAVHGLSNSIKEFHLKRNRSPLDYIITWLQLNWCGAWG